MNERLQTKDTLTPIATAIKQGRQLDFQRRIVTQEHGSRGTRRDKVVDWDLRKPKIGERGHIDEQLREMSPKQLELAANAILAATVQQETDFTFSDMADGSDVTTFGSDPSRNETAIPEATDETEEEPLPFDNEFYDPKVDPLSYAGADALRFEANTALRNSKKHQAERDYEGASPEDDQDYLSGLSFRSRP